MNRVFQEGSEGISLQERKAVCSLCALLNAGCVNTKGLQLLISMMLIARSTGKQVEN